MEHASWWNDDWSERPHGAAGAGARSGPCFVAPLIAPADPASDAAEPVGDDGGLQVESAAVPPPARAPLTARLRAFFEPLSLTRARIMEQALAFREPPLQPG